MYKCPSCGGQLLYDPETMGLKCNSCHNTFKLDTISETESAEHLNGFTCPNCGGKLIGTGDQFTGFCPFCGSQVEMKTTETGVKEPDGIAPFTVSKDACKSIFTNAIKKCGFTPREFTNPDFLRRAQGVYIPFTQYDANIKGTIMAEGERGGGSDYDVYLVSGSSQGGYVSTIRDASNGLDDELSEALNFQANRWTGYSPVYLSGFYADIPDVDPAVYADEAQAECENAAVREMFKATHLDDGGKHDLTHANTKLTTKEVLYPAWFLTLRYNDRVSYSLINGTNGNFVAKFPVDMSKFLILALCIAVPIFAILSIAPIAVRHMTAVLWCAVISFISGLICLNGTIGALRSEAEKYGHRTGGIGKAVAREVSGISARGGRLIAITIAAFIICGAFVSTMSDYLSFTFIGPRNGGLLLLLIYIITALVELAIKSRYKWNEDDLMAIKRRFNGDFLIFSVSMLLPSIYCIIGSVYNLVSYGVMIFTLLLSWWLMIRSIQSYNIRVTNPIGYFEKRKGIRNERI
ncbi:MAG: hypothetical protein SPL99_05030 [Catonella sp.]|nr:hypothetical protein [Catonella sp.]